MDSLAFPIIPKHILEGIPPSSLPSTEFNRYPVGTGPYTVAKNTEDLVVLDRNKRYFKGAPEISQIQFVLFATEEEALEAAKQFTIHILAQTSAEISEELKPYEAYVEYAFSANQRQKIIFFNLRNQGPTSSLNIRKALSAATDKELLVESIPGGGTPAEGPIPITSWAYNSDIDRYSFDEERAKNLLEEDGWTLPEAHPKEGILEGKPIRVKGDQELVVTISYLDNSLNQAIVEKLQQQWAQVGIKVDLDPQTYERISTETVPRRNFDLLLFEIETTPDPDKYNLWHSTKGEYPGLNLPGYSYERSDILLERARTEVDKDLRLDDYLLFQKYILQEVPTLYLFHPNHSFFTHDSVHGIELSGALLPHHRYQNVQDWYIEL